MSQDCETFNGKNMWNLFGQTKPLLRMASRTILIRLLKPGRSPAAAMPPRLKSRLGRERKKSSRPPTIGITEG